MKRSTATLSLLADVQASRLHWRRKSERLRAQLLDAQLTVGGVTDTLERLRRGIRLARADMTGVARRRFDNIIKKHLGEDL